LHKHAVLHLRERLPKLVAEPVRVAEAGKAAVAGDEAAALRCTPLHPAQRT
jgi:hypothetical protein